MEDLAAAFGMKTQVLYTCIITPGPVLCGIIILYKLTIHTHTHTHTHRKPSPEYTAFKRTENLVVWWMTEASSSTYLKKSFKLWPTSSSRGGGCLS